jgi:HD-like signal output (HDOD) protein
MGGARPPRPAVAGLTESDLVTLYGVGVVRPIAAGESFVPSAGACYFVIEGPLELCRTTNGVSVSLGVVGRGECLEAATDGAPPYTVMARDTASVIELSALAFDLLPPATQRALGRIAALSSARRFDTLAARHAALAGRNAHLVSLMKDASARARRVLASPPLRQALAEIPALPVHATGLASKLLDDRTRADEVVESIKNDPALAGLVLKRVNSAFYGLETKVSDHYRALLLLGTATVYQLILESAIESVIPDTPESRDIQARATLVAVLAYEIAIASGQGHPLLASTIGLLHNIGDSIALLIRRTRPDAAALIDCVEPPALGAAMLTGWGLPERVSRVVEQQDQPKVLLPEELDVHGAELAVLYLARVCHDVLLERATPPANAGDYMARLGLREMDCATFCRETLVPALARKVDALPAAVRARLQS